MRFLSIMGNSFGCSVSGERLMSAARDGDVQEAKALLEYNPHLARYSTSGVHNSPLHYAAARGHHEIVYLLLESDVEIDLENYRGQSALMQACYHGHWEVVQSLMLFRANVHKVDYLNGGAALHFAATNGHTRCTRLLLADYVPSIPHFWNFTSKRSPDEDSTTEFDEGSSLPSILNKTADGSFTALHMAALYGHAETVHLLVSFGASVSEVTTDERTIIDPIGRGSTPLHYAASGGNAQCCQLLIAKGASLTAENSNGLTPLMVARLRERHWLEGILNKQQPECQLEILPSPYLSLPLMSIVKIARECGWRDDLDSLPRCVDPCSVCLERKCTVATKGCGHEFCTSCALYLCSTNCTSIPTPFPLGSIACPLCRRGIVSFIKLLNTDPINEMATTSTTCSSNGSSETASFSTLFCKHDIQCTQILPLRSFSLRAFICQKFPSRKLNSSPCMGAPDTSSSPAPCDNSSHPQNQMGRCSRLVLPRSASHIDGRRSCFSLNQYVTSFKLRKDQYITTDND